MKDKFIEVIEQEKSDEELTKKGDEIINLLKDFNWVEKYKIISALNESLDRVLKSKGILIQEIKKQKGDDDK